MHRSYNLFFFFNDTATTEIYTLSLHDALPIWLLRPRSGPPPVAGAPARRGRLPHRGHRAARAAATRSEEHTSELQSRQYLVCRLLLEKKKTQTQFSKLCSDVLSNSHHTI